MTTINRMHMHKPRLSTNSVNKLTEDELTRLEKDIDNLAKSSWGKMHASFIRNILINAKTVILAKEQKKLIGISIFSEKYIFNKSIYYGELSLVHPEYQGNRISEKMSQKAISRQLLKNIMRLKFNIEVLLITPNARVLGMAANYASFMYPNPYDFDNCTKKMPLPDQQTFDIARELIKQSDKPERRIDKEACVLNGSYSDCNWLIYNKYNKPTYRQKIVNDFAEHYLDYNKRKDKEFIVRTRFNVVSLLRFLVSFKNEKQNNQTI